jgi:hypothetical protein
LYVALGPEECKVKPQGEKEKEAPVFTKKVNAQLKQRIEILDWHHVQGNKQSQGKTAEHWNAIYPNLHLKQPIISTWLYENDIPPAHIYDINILEAMCLADIAWKEVDMMTIRNCWQKTKILPDTLFYLTSFTTPTIPVASLLNDSLKNTTKAAEKELSNSLSHLQKIGVLQS